MITSKLYQSRPFSLMKCQQGFFLNLFTGSILYNALSDSATGKNGHFFLWVSNMTYRVLKRVILVTTPSSRVTHAFATLPCGLFVTCRAKIYL